MTPRASTGATSNRGQDDGGQAPLGAAIGRRQVGIDFDRPPISAKDEVMREYKAVMPM